MRWTTNQRFTSLTAQMRRALGVSTSASVRFMPTSYAPVHNDWEPLSPKDAVTMLGDITREKA